VATEHERIRELSRIFASGRGDAGSAGAHGVRIGIGDDAALLEPSAAPCVLTVDAQVEGVHFRRDWMTLQDVGYRALVSAVSDLAAMCASPRGALCSWVLPAQLADAELYAIAEGTAEAARHYQCPIVGGNLARGRELSLTTTAVGAATSSTPTRAAARAGDALFVIGELGMSALGRHALQAGRPELAPESVARFRRPVARVTEALAASALARAAIDVSDGLLQDLEHVAAASDVGFELDVDALPTCSEHAAACQALGLDARALALAGGEDYALLFTAPPDATPSVGVRVGHAVAKRGLVLYDHRGQRVEPPAARGFDHFGG
jgi:thiamine-monophosphate kinase